MLSMSPRTFAAASSSGAMTDNTARASLRLVPSDTSVELAIVGHEFAFGLLSNWARVDSVTWITDPFE
jgi:hypothetical protein